MKMQLDPLTSATERAIEAAKALEPDQWPSWSENIYIFTLCRYLASIDNGIQADDLEPYVMAFWSAIKQPEDWDDAWEQFLDLWDHQKIRTPVGNLADIAAQRASRTKDPDWAIHYRPTMRFLIRICIEMAKMFSSKKGFGLAQNDVARILNCTQQAAGTKLHKLCRDGVLAIIDKPPNGTKKAFRYQLLKPYPNYQMLY